MHHKMCWNSNDNQAANDSSNGSHVTWLASITSDPFGCRFAAVRIKRAMLQDQVSVPEFGQNVRQSHVVNHMHYVGAVWVLQCQPQVLSRYIYPLFPIYMKSAYQSLMVSTVSFLQMCQSLRCKSGVLVFWSLYTQTDIAMVA